MIHFRPLPCRCSRSRARRRRRLIIECSRQLDAEWHALLFGVSRSIRYHTRRLMFFERIRQLTTIVVLISVRRRLLPC